jgi:hypothetical protein
MKTRKPFLLRIEPRLYDALEAWAQQEMRSVNGQIEYLLTQAVDKRLKVQLDAEQKEPTRPPVNETTRDKDKTP